jgi:hypothetical protein
LKRASAAGAAWCCEGEEAGRPDGSAHALRVDDASGQPLVVVVVAVPWVAAFNAHIPGYSPRASIRTRTTPLGPHDTACRRSYASFNRSPKQKNEYRRPLSLYTHSNTSIAHTHIKKQPPSLTEGRWRQKQQMSRKRHKGERLMRPLNRSRGSVIFLLSWYRLSGHRIGSCRFGITCFFLFLLCLFARARARASGECGSQAERGGCLGAGRGRPLVG